MVGEAEPQVKSIVRAPRNPIRVGIVSFGFGEYCTRLASGLATMADVGLFMPFRLSQVQSWRLDPTVEFCSLEKARLRNPMAQFRVIGRVLRSVREFDPHVIHLQQGHLWFNFALPLLSRYPLVLTIHDPRYHIGDRASRWTPEAIMRRGFRRADQVIVHGERQKEEVRTVLRIPDVRIHVIPHIALGAAPTNREVKQGSHEVLFFGRIWQYKGLEYLIRAEPLITAEVPDAKIVIAGRGESLDRYRRMMVHPDRFIVYNDYISDNKRAELFQRASLVVLPYVQASQSGVIPVAYMHSKPVVATKVGGLPEMVEDGRTGYLVPPRDEKELAFAIIRLLQDSALRRELGRNARNKIEAECAPEIIARKTLEVYRYAVESENSNPEPSFRAPQVGIEPE